MMSTNCQRPSRPRVREPLYSEIKEVILDEYKSVDEVKPLNFPITKLRMVRIKKTTNSKPSVYRSSSLLKITVPKIDMTKIILMKCPMNIENESKDGIPNSKQPGLNKNQLKPENPNNTTPCRIARTLRENPMKNKSAQNVNGFNAILKINKTELSKTFLKNHCEAKHSEVNQSKPIAVKETNDSFDCLETKNVRREKKQCKRTNSSRISREQAASTPKKRFKSLERIAAALKSPFTRKSSVKEYKFPESPSTPKSINPKSKKRTSLTDRIVSKVKSQFTPKGNKSQKCCTKLMSTLFKSDIESSLTDLYQPF